jgi:periplasmic divalent cation tolerance protein
MAVSDLCLVYVTASSKEQALEIGRALVDERLAACVNVLPGMTSVYRWKGAVEETQEAVLIVKTEQGKAERVIEAVKRTHTYEVPCALVVPITGGNPQYMGWLRGELA